MPRDNEHVIEMKVVFSARVKNFTMTMRVMISDHFDVIGIKVGFSARVKNFSMRS